MKLSYGRKKHHCASADFMERCQVAQTNPELTLYRGSCIVLSYD